MNVERDIGKEKNQPTGLVLELPPRFQVIPPEFPDKQPDHLIGILIETDKNRIQLLKETVGVIEEGNHLAVIHTDVDWLKYLNDTIGIGRDLGDKAIKHSVCAVAKNINEIFPQNPEFKIRFLKAAYASDETWFYILNISEKRLELLEELKKQITMETEILLPNSPGRGISFSVGFSHSGENRYKELLKETKEKLKTGLKLPYDLFKQLQEDASLEAHQKKFEKILNIANKLSKQENLDEFINLAVKELGGLRLDPKILRYLLKQTKKRSINNSYG